MRGSTAATRLLAPAVATLVTALVVAPGACAGINKATEFSTGITAGAGLEEIAPGPDGEEWFTEREGGRIGRISASGAVTEFSAGITPGSGPVGITVGPEGNLWFTEREGGRIGRISASGVVTEFSAGITSGSAPVGITLGPEGNLWFTEREGDRIGRITPAGEVSEFSKGIATGSAPQAITKGQEGNLWFTEPGANRIARITPSGEITQFAGIRRKSDPLDIATGLEGDLWFTEEGGNRIGRMTPTGEVSEYSNGINDSPADIAVGPDGNLWFTDSEGHRIGRITPSGEAKRFSAGISPASGLHGIAAGSDGNLWFTESAGNRIGRVVSGAPPASVSVPALSGAAVVGKSVQCAGGVWVSWATLQPSASAFAFDGYRWLLDGAVIATGQSYTPSATNAGHQLACAETVTYPLLDVSASAASAAATVTVGPQSLAGARCCGKGGKGGIGIGGGVTFRLSPLTQSASTWREGAKLASLARAKAPPIGTTFRFTLNESAKIRFAFTHRVSGRKVNGECTAATTNSRRAPSCVRTLTVGVLSLVGHSGSDRLYFQGRISRSRKLAPGRYTLRVTAANAAGQRSQTRTVSFTIVA